VSALAWATEPCIAAGEVNGMRTIAAVGWLAIVGALLIWQGLGLIRGPRVADVV